MKDKIYALLVIDMQQVAFDGKITAPISQSNGLLNNLAGLISTCRETNTPVIYAQTRAPSGQPYAQDAHGWEIHPQVAPVPGETILFKVGPSVFENPDIESVLGQRGTTHLIVCGIWTEGCVSITVRGALKRGYQVCLPSNGHSTVRQTESEAIAVIAEENDQLAARGVQVESIETISARLKQQTSSL